MPLGTPLCGFPALVAVGVGVDSSIQLAQGLIYAIVVVFGTSVVVFSIFGTLVIFFTLLLMPVIDMILCCNCPLEPNATGIIWLYIKS